jgi:hypothetical protein
VHDESQALLQNIQPPLGLVGESVDSRYTSFTHHSPSNGFIVFAVAARGSA